MLALLLHYCATVGATNPNDAFDQANKLYEQGRYSQAAAAYQDILETGQTSAALYFNLGNAFFKAGRFGNSIANYRIAQRLTPRDPDVRANLKFARHQVNPSGSAPPFSHRLLGLLSLNELTALACLCFWAWFGILTVREAWPRGRAALRLATNVAATATILSATWLAASVHFRLSAPVAIVVKDDVQVRYGPLEESKPHFSPRDGAELSVLGRKDDWLQVTDSAGRTGWLSQDQVVVLPPS